MESYEEDTYIRRMRKDQASLGTRLEGRRGRIDGGMANEVGVLVEPFTWLT
jgi:hypothetical protein